MAKVKVITTKQMERKIKSAPAAYRVGATCVIARRIKSYWSESKKYQNKNIFIAKVRENASLINKEQKLLDQLPKRHKYNQQKNSNIRTGETGGFVYAIQMKPHQANIRKKRKKGRENKNVWS